MPVSVSRSALPLILCSACTPPFTSNMWGGKTRTTDKNQILESCRQREFLTMYHDHDHHDHNSLIKNFDLDICNILTKMCNS